MKLTRTISWEDSNTGKTIEIGYDEIEELALEDGLEIDAKDMDDDTFNHYCEAILANYGC